LSDTNRLRPLRVQFHAARLIHHKHRTALRLHPPVVHIQHVFLGPVFGVEELVKPFGSAHLQSLADHNRPRRDREEDQENDDDLRFKRGLFPHVKQLRRVGLANSCPKEWIGVHPDTISLRLRELGREELKRPSGT
jgi:hypothetical protein